MFSALQSEENIKVEFMGSPSPFSTTARLRGVDEANDFAVLQLDSAAPFPLPAAILGSPSTGPGVWESYCAPVPEHMGAGQFVTGNTIGLVDTNGKTYMRLAVSSPDESIRPVSGAPVVTADHLVGVVSVRQNDGTLLAVLISEMAKSKEGNIIGSLMGLPNSDTKTRKEPAEWLDKATIDRFSEQVWVIIRGADRIRTERNKKWIHTEDLLLSLASESGGEFFRLLVDANVDLRSIIGDDAPDLVVVPDDVEVAREVALPRISPYVRRAFAIARDKANEGGSKVIEESHVLFGVLSISGHKTVRALNDLGITPDKIVLHAQTVAETDTAFVLAGYKSDDPSGDDLLGITKEVNALASVLAAGDVDPPLSLGLFGDWGSGKSFFMRQLQSRVQTLQDAAQQTKVKSAYCKDIVQITFNAWNYIDTDLWASLAAELFEGLAAKVAEKRGKDSQEERALVLAAASSSQTVLEEAERKKNEAERELSQVEENLAKLKDTEAGVEASLRPRELLAQAYRFAIEQDEVQANIASAAKELKFSEAQAAADEVKSEILELNNIWSTIIFTMRNNKNLWLWLLAFVIAVGLSLVVYLFLKKLDIGYVAGRSIAALTALSGFLSPFVWGSRKALTFVKAARASRSELIENKKKQASEQLIQERENIRSKIAATQNTIDLAAKNVTELNRRLEQMRADRQMADYIRQRNQSSDYTQHLGVIARVRTDFKHLSTLLRDVQKESEKEMADMKARQLETEKDSGRSLFPRIDRIILYIDDLDRCPEKIVVDVLQAVHLLLAFPLFVVVVGVDPRWLLHSLQQHSVAFRTGTKYDPGSAESPEDYLWQSTPMNYLEKIFQIPFTLRPIGKLGFEKLVEEFAAPMKSRTDLPQPGVKPPSPSTGLKQEAPVDPGASSTSLGSHLGPASPEVQAVVIKEGAADTSRALASDTRVVPTGRPPHPAAHGETTSLAEVIDQNPEHLRIEKWEREFMKKLFELIPSPRAGKRFINIYRLLRASVEDSERTVFIGDSQSGDYKSALMLLGILTAYPTEATEILKALIELEPTQRWGEFLDQFRVTAEHTSNATELPKTQFSLRRATNGGRLASGETPPSEAHRWSELFTKLDAIDDSLYDRPCDAFNKWASRVARYSFQSGRVLLYQRE